MIAVAVLVVVVLVMDFGLDELAELRSARRLDRVTAAEAYAALVRERPSDALAVAIESHWAAVRSAGMACDCEACKLDPSEVRAMGDSPPPSPEPDVWWGG